MDGRVNAAGLNFTQKNPYPAAAGDELEIHRFRSESSSTSVKRTNIGLTIASGTDLDLVVKYGVQRSIYNVEGTLYLSGYLQSGNILNSSVTLFDRGDTPADGGWYVSATDGLLYVYVETVEARLGVKIKATRGYVNPDGVQPQPDAVSTITNPEIEV